MKSLINIQETFEDAALGDQKLITGSKHAEREITVSQEIIAGQQSRVSAPKQQTEIARLIQELMEAAERKTEVLGHAETERRTRAMLGASIQRGG